MSYNTRYTLYQCKAAFLKTLTIILNFNNILEIDRDNTIIIIIIIITIIIIFIITSILIINFIIIKIIITIIIIIIIIIIILSIITIINAYQELTFTVVKHEPPKCYITISQAVHQFWNVIQNILFSESSFFKVIHHLRII